MDDIKTMKDVKSNWMIEEVYPSSVCRHKMVGHCTLGYINQRKGIKCFHQCEKENCPLRVK